jgi:hypothetical protein
MGACAILTSNDLQITRLDTHFVDINWDIQITSSDGLKIRTDCTTTIPFFTRFYRNLAPV